MIWNKKANTKEVASLISKSLGDLDRCVDRSIGKSTILNEDVKHADGATTTYHPLAEFQRNEIQVGRLVGAGSFCQVLEVKKIKLVESGKFSESQEESRRRVKDDSKISNIVIKHLNAKKLVDATKKGFRRAASDLILEAMYLSKIQHENIVKVVGMSRGGPGAYEDGKHDGFFLLMERLPSTLTSCMQEWRKKGSRHDREHLFATKCTYASQIARALNYLHQRRMVYRDLKPDNIGVSADQQTVKLFDFGFCSELPSPKNRLDDDETFRLPACGTPRYCSPEMLMGEPYNCKTDVYSWSLLFYVMLSDKVPYQNYTLDMVVLKVCNLQERPKLAELGLPKQFQSLIRRSWEHRISHRLSMATVCQAMESGGVFVDEKKKRSIPRRSSTSVHEWRKLSREGRHQEPQQLAANPAAA